MDLLMFDGVCLVLLSLVSLCTGVCVCVGGVLVFLAHQAWRVVPVGRLATPKEEDDTPAADLDRRGHYIAVWLSARWWIVA